MLRRGQRLACPTAASCFGISCPMRWRRCWCRWCWASPRPSLRSPTSLGVGVPADTVTWGSILNEARSNTFAWWLAVFPGAAIFVAVISYYMVGEGLRDALDPRLK